jgi:hypothetical protein
MGDGTIGIERWAQLYREQCSNTIFTLEIITSLPAKLLNYLEPEYWDAYPDLPAAEFAEFLRLAQDGKPYTQPVLTASWSELRPEYKPALATQQRLMLEKSVRYCRNVLQLGE